MNTHLLTFLQPRLLPEGTTKSPTELVFVLPYRWPGVSSLLPASLETEASGFCPLNEGLPHSCGKRSPKRAHSLLNCDLGAVDVASTDFSPTSGSTLEPHSTGCRRSLSPVQLLTVVEESFIMVPSLFPALLDHCHLYLPTSVAFEPGCFLLRTEGTGLWALSSPLHPFPSLQIPPLDHRHQYSP